MDEFVDAYAILGVSPDASQAELRDAHRRLVRRHHPDLAAPADRKAATQRVQTINMAYGLVRHEQARARYDAFRRRWRAQQAAAAGAERVEAGDAALAKRWEELAGAAGRWAGAWWAREGGVARRTGRALGRLLR